MIPCKNETFRKMAHRPISLTVLDTVQAAAADITFGGGKLEVTGLGEVIDLSDATDYSFDAYAAGTASIKEYDLAGVSLVAGITYRLAVVVDGHVDFHGGGKEANELIPIREYVVSAGASAPTADELRDLFIQRINEDPNALVTAASGGAGVVELTLDSVDEGDFRVESPAGTVEAVTTPFVAPAGTPEVVTENGGNPNPAGAYDTYTIFYNDKRRHNGVSGGLVEYPEFVKIYLESTDGDTAAFETAMDAILDGTHTPVSDYLGV